MSREPSAVWNEVLDMAADHGLVPLLFKRLKESDARAHVPVDAWKQLRQVYFDSASANVRLYRKLGPVLRCLRSSGIKVIVLKGAFLAEAVYGDVALRPMGDVDLMVTKAELPRAHAVLLDTGRVHRRPEDAESRLWKNTKLWLTPVVSVDLCWTIDVPGGRSRLDLTGLWERARPATIAGVEVLALSPEDLLLHLCLHAAHRHGLGFGLLPLCDIAKTIHRFRSEIDWAQVVDRARKWRASRYVGLTLHLARRMLGAGVPDDVLEQLVPGGIDARIIETAREAVLGQRGYHELMPFFGRLGAKCLGDKAKLFWERVFLSREEMAAIYPASRNSRHIYLYYALRLRDVIRTYWSHVLSRGRLLARSRRRDRTAALVKWLKED
ncbi:MAG: nucleotidyltransferase family protein [candidate division WOR-3 bacterium]|nr:nucleotidyltransferase family protein [candidate division WOR-3 bacterium]